MTTTCQNCHREGVDCQPWRGNDDAPVYGWFPFWCGRCILTAQIAYAKAVAERLPDLEAKLAALPQEPK